MSERFDLKRMLDEIREDQAAESTKAQKLTPDGVRIRVASRRRRARNAGGTNGNAPANES